MREEIIRYVLKEKVIAIVRGIESTKCMRVAEALYEGGIRLVEVTFNQSEPASFAATADTIATINKKYEGKMLVGAGTVTTTELVELAANAWAKYIISPRY